MPPNLFPLEPTNHHRADTIALKKRLQELLPGPEGRTYWRAFSELLGAQITRKEFDAATSAILSSNEAAAETHNALILAVLYNVFQPTEHYVTPHKPRKSLGHHDGEGGGWFDGAKRKAAEETPEDRTRERAKQAVMALGKRERSRLKRLPDLLSQPTPSFMQPRASPFMQSPAQSPGSTTKPVDIQEQARWDAVESCSAAGDLPRDPASLGDRMSSIAHRINLHSAGPEAGQLMMDAVQVRTPLRYPEF